MNDLTEWLLACIAEDEAVARDATPGPWRVNDDAYAEAIYAADGMDVASGGKWSGEASIFDTSDALHMARWHPARVLAECEAKKRRVTLHSAVCCIAPSRPAGVCVRCHDEATCGDDESAWYPCTTLRLEAVPYSDHPDFREEWRP